MQTPEFREAVSKGLIRYHALHPMTVETKEKIRQGNLDKVMSVESRQRISESKMGKPSSKKGKPQPSSSYKRSKETRWKMSEGRKRMLSQRPEIMESVSDKLSGRILSEETKQKTSASKIQYYMDHPEAAKAHSERMKGRKNPTFSRIVRRLWQENAYIEMLIKARNVKPNKPEIALGNLLRGLYPGHFKYNGDCRLGVVLNRCIPDFVNVNGKKQVIEFFGSYWHNEGERGEKEKIAKYKQVGWDCLVVWDTEFAEIDVLKDKIRTFVGGRTVCTKP